MVWCSVNQIRLWVWSINRRSSAANSSAAASAAGSAPFAAMSSRLSKLRTATPSKTSVGTPPVSLHDRFEAGVEGEVQGIGAHAQYLGVTGHEWGVLVAPVAVELLKAHVVPVDERTGLRRSYPTSS